MSLPRPSKAGVWSRCSASHALSAALPATDSDAAARGRHIHSVAAALIDARARGVSDPAHDLDDEAYKQADFYANHCVDLMRTHAVFGGPSLGLERTLPASFDIQANDGTPDFFLYSRAKQRIVIRDLKTGYVPVDAFENRQLIIYADYIAKTLQLDDFATYVEFGIVQPNAFRYTGPVDLWGPIRLADLRPLINQARTAAGEIAGGNGKFKPGAHCLECDAKLTCTAATLHGLRVFEHERDTPYHTVDHSPMGLSRHYALVEEAADLLGKIKDGLESLIIEALRRGEPVPRYGLEAAAGSLDWTVPDEQVIKFGELCGVPLKKPDAPITPTQAIGKGISEAMVKQFAKRGNGKIKLIKTNTAQKEFTK